MPSQFELLADLQDCKVYIIDAWKFREVKTELGLKFAWERMQDLLWQQREIASALLDTGLKLGEDFDMFIPMDEQLAV